MRFSALPIVVLAATIVVAAPVARDDAAEAVVAAVLAFDPSNTRVALTSDFPDSSLSTAADTDVHVVEVSESDHVSTAADLAGSAVATPTARIGQDLASDQIKDGWHFTWCWSWGGGCIETTTTSTEASNPTSSPTDAWTTDATLPTIVASSASSSSWSVVSAASSAAASLDASVGSSVAASTAASATSSAAASTITGSTGTNSNKHVVAHFMVGIVSEYTTSDWVEDIQLAKSKGITGFALNIGVDPYTQTQLDLAYDAAAQVGDFDLFISFDFNWYSVSDTSGVATMMKRYVDKSAQLLVDGKPFVSSFIGDGFDWATCATLVGREIYAVPFFQPSYAGDSGVSGLFSWAAWPGQQDNQPVLANMTTDHDESYLSALNAVGKTYMAPISPWFNTHFGNEVSYSKNWLFYSEMLWKTRWDQILQLGSQGVNFVEIVTWNDYGESHNVGPYSSAHSDDGSSKWAKGLDHSAMLDFAVPYIEAFKQGKTEPVITTESLVYWHRPHLKSASCDSTDNCGSKPDGWDMVSDSVFIATMTTSGGTVTINSGSNGAVTRTVDAGVQAFEVPMSAGKLSFTFKTNAGVSASGDSAVEVTESCWNGIYNYNFHSGTVA